ncbi:MAG: flagellin lysine-N-methylase [Alphaproteobacteria bacterium]|nr:flagellin lysine-N-methylase [Alphaproteobacteria bacterium]
MTHALTQTTLISSFQCLGEACEDTCCQNWSMQLDAPTLAKYESAAPELLAAVEREEGGLPVMRRDPATRHCVKMENGLCGIHKRYGDAMLGDACHFYPRVTRTLGQKTLMTATPSCPEIVRLMLALEMPFAPVDGAALRLPHSLKNYLPEGMDEAVALAVHQAFLDCALDASLAPQQALAHIASVARSMELLDAKTLDQSVPLYLRLAGGRLPVAEAHPADAFNLLHALCGLIVASHKPISDRLRKTISDMERSLQATLDWERVQISLGEGSAAALADIRAKWQEASPHYAHALRRYLAMQLSLALFPFAGLGGNASERVTFIGVRFATIKLALACAHHLHGPLAGEDIVRIIQSLSRFMDHLGDAAFSLSIYAETGWNKEARLLALCA